MKHTLLAFFTLLSARLLAPLAALRADDAFLVKDGQARAEIVISDQPQRTVGGAAKELQSCIEKISGAHLPIVTTPGGNGMAKIFIGKSAHTAQLTISAADLKFGAYRIVTGADWMVLIGDDTEFTPVGPFAQNNGDIPRARAEWEALTNSKFGMPGAGLYKHRMKLPGDTGKPDGTATAKNESLEMVRLP